ncbi:MAG TPA: hypothetical protein VLA73_07915 [Burkholderiales bacterium]|nr:hypothetical protein [Burkholderiales bacterium]
MNNTQPKSLPAIAVLTLLFAAPGVYAADGKFSFTTGIDYSTGDYGADEDTDILYVPFTGKYETERWFFRLTVPYLRITGPGAVVLGPDGNPIVVSANGTARRETHDGVGDVIFGAAYNLLPGTWRGVVLDIGAKVKFPTADEDKGLGTGETDYQLQADAYKTFGRWTAIGTFGYKWLGDPDDFTLKDVFFGSIGAGYKFSQQTSGGLIFDFREASVSGSDPLQELVAYVTHKLTGTTKLQGYAVAGLTESSPDWGLGATVTFDF